MYNTCDLFMKQLSGNTCYNHFKSKLVFRDRDDTDEKYKAKLTASHNRRLQQAQKTLEIIKNRFSGMHNSALYAVIGDFNDTPYSPYVKPLVNSNLLFDVLGKLRPNDRWTYYWRSASKVSQIDYILASKSLYDRIKTHQVPHIERKGLSYKKLNSNDEILPKTTKYISYESDLVTSPSNIAPADERIDFRFDRYQEVLED